MDILKRHIKIARLIFKQKFSDLEKEDNKVLDSWIEEEDHNKSMYEGFENIEYSDLKSRYGKIDVDRQWQRFESKTSGRKIRILPSLAIAASIALVLGLSIFVYNNIHKDSDIISLNQKESVRLILGNGEDIRLETGNEDITLASGNVSIKNKDKQLVYSGKTGLDKIENNTLIVPKAGFYHLILSDGTKVWLNSDTKLTYPVAFVGKMRVVNLSGEAYFEVAHNKEKPFIVETSKMDVKVLGTVFNVNTHADNGKVSAVLVEGKVEVGKNEMEKVILSPGQIAQLNINGANSGFIVKDVDVSQYVAWKDGVFSFRGTSMSEILKRIERYYNVQIVYTKKIGEEYFTGDISRDKSLESLLNVLELSTSVKFEIKGKRVYVK